MALTKFNLISNGTSNQYWVSTTHITKQRSVPDGIIIIYQIYKFAHNLIYRLIYILVYNWNMQLHIRKSIQTPPLSLKIKASCKRQTCIILYKQNMTKHSIKAISSLEKSFIVFVIPRSQNRIKLLCQYHDISWQFSLTVARNLPFIEFLKGPISSHATTSHKPGLCNSNCRAIILTLFSALAASIFFLYRVQWFDASKLCIWASSEFPGPISFCTATSYLGTTVMGCVVVMIWRHAGGTARYQMARQTCQAHCSWGNQMANGKWQID